MTKGERQKGFILKLILVLIAVLLVMKFLGLTFSGVYQWFMHFFGSVLK